MYLRYIDYKVNDTCTCTERLFCEFTAIMLCAVFKDLL